MVREPTFTSWKTSLLRKGLFGSCSGFMNLLLTLALSIHVIYFYVILDRKAKYNFNQVLDENVGCTEASIARRCLLHVLVKDKKEANTVKVLQLFK